MLSSHAFPAEHETKHQQTFDGDVLPLQQDPNPRNVRLMSHVGYTQIATDIWGYTAPDGREYACMGLLNGVTIVDITNPASPREIAYIQGVESQWRDLKTFGEYLFVVADQGEDGLVVIDLTELPNRARMATRFEDFDQAHNLHIDTESGMAFIAGSERGKGGVRIVDVNDPLNPVARGVYDDHYCHDAHGRDGLLFTFEGHNAGAVLDVSNPDAPRVLSRFTYPGQAYTHSGWPTADLEYLLVNDEFDELPQTKHDGHDAQIRTRVIVMRRVGDTFNYQPFSEYHGPNRASDHNVFIHEGFAYLSNYTFGLTVIDLADMAAPTFYANYDTYPSTDAEGFAGAWGTYPFFPSGTVILSDRSSGLYVFDVLEDRDRDGLPDDEDPQPDIPDSDADGLPDGWEISHGLDPLSPDGVDGPDGDPDNDRLNNLWEYLLGTDPNRADSDGDGLTDGQEHERGSDPVDRNSPGPDDAGVQKPEAGCSASTALTGSPAPDFALFIVLAVLFSIRQRTRQNSH